jgi:chemotaxis protein histidine kinase CheA
LFGSMCVDTQPFAGVAAAVHANANASDHPQFAPVQPPTLHAPLTTLITLATPPTLLPKKPKPAAAWEKAHRKQLKKVLRAVQKAVGRCHQPASKPVVHRRKKPSKPVAVPVWEKAHRKQLKTVLRAVQKAVSHRETQMRMKGAHLRDDTEYQHQHQHQPQRLTADERVRQVKRLRDVVQPEQRSEAWYMQRERMITASDFGGMLKTANTRVTLAFQKATALRARRDTAATDVVPCKPRATNEACEWGIKFEPVCDMVYRMLRPGAVTEEFGLLPHPTHEFIGASPDGICNESSASDYVGRLVEYKAPFSRKLRHGYVPVDYLAQMQGQLEVTGLDTCDYLECSFRIETRESAQLRAACKAAASAAAAAAVENADENPNPQPSQPSPSPSPSPASSDRACIAQGILIEIPGRSGGYRYGSLHSVDDATRRQALDALSDTERRFAVVRYWVLQEYQLVTVCRNKDWFQTVLYPSLCETWALANAFLEDNHRYEEETRTRNENRAKRSSKPRGATTVEYSFRST